MGVAISLLVVAVAVVTAAGFLGRRPNRSAVVPRHQGEVHVHGDVATVTYRFDTRIALEASALTGLLDRATQEVHGLAARLPLDLVRRVQVVLESPEGEVRIPPIPFDQSPPAWTPPLHVRGPRYDTALKVSAGPFSAAPVEPVPDVLGPLRLDLPDALGRRLRGVNPAEDLDALVVALLEESGHTVSAVRPSVHLARRPGGPSLYVETRASEGDVELDDVDVTRFFAAVDTNHADEGLLVTDAYVPLAAWLRARRARRFELVGRAQLQDVIDAVCLQEMSR